MAANLEDLVPRGPPVLMPPVLPAHVAETPEQRIHHSRLFFTRTTFNLVNERENRVNLSLLSPVAPPHGIAPAALFPGPGFVAGGAAQPRIDGEDDSPGDYNLLINRPEKLPRQVDSAHAHRVVGQFMNQPHHLFHGMTNLEAINLGIGYVNQFCNCRIPEQMIESNTLDRGQILIRTHKAMKRSCLAMVLHCIAYGWKTQVQQLGSLALTAQNRRNRQAHHMLVMVLLKFVCQYMNPEGDFNWDHVLKLKLKQFIMNVRRKMVRFGIWSVNNVKQRLDNDENPLNGIVDNWIGGVRYEYARLIVHLVRIDPNTDWLHPTLGACTNNERNTVRDQLPFDAANNVIPRREDS
jgi:hypothetical protein